MVTSSATESTEETSKPKTKGKPKAKAAGKELISDGHLRLKAGIHYGLIGRNGTGKSSRLDNRKHCLQAQYIDVTSAPPGNGRKTHPRNPTFDSHGNLAADGRTS